MKDGKRKGLHRRKISKTKRFLVCSVTSFLVLLTVTSAYADVTGTSLSGLVMSMVDQIAGNIQQTETSDLNNLSAKYKNASDQTVQQIKSNTQSTLQSYEQEQISNADSNLNSYLQKQQQQLDSVANQEIQKSEQSIQGQVIQNTQVVEQQIQSELQNQLQNTNENH